MQEKQLEGLAILLVEEEPFIAMDIEQLCMDHGARVTTINSFARLPREVTQLGSIDGTILEAKLGEDWTTDFARRLVEWKIPFLFATGFTDAEPLFAEFPNVAVVAKPYSGNELIEALAKALGRGRSDDRD